MGHRQGMSGPHLSSPPLHVCKALARWRLDSEEVEDQPAKPTLRRKLCERDGEAQDVEEQTKRRSVEIERLATVEVENCSTSRRTTEELDSPPHEWRPVRDSGY